MKVVYGFENLPSLNKPVLTIGSFDGVHAGHRALLNLIVQKSKQENKTSIVMSFSPHPRAVLDVGEDKVSLLNSLDEKILLLKELGIDILLIVPFTVEFSKLSYVDFVRDFLLAKLGISALVIGPGHHFGYNQSGTFETLAQMQNDYDFEIIQVQKILVGDGKVSSTVVRRLIQNGEMQAASECLTKPYFMILKINELGKLMLKDNNKLLPKSGEYSVSVESEGQVFKDKLIVENLTLRLVKYENMLIGTEFIVKFV